jgi:glutathione S-transferase
MALIMSGINCAVREVRLSNKPPQMIAASPKATVPVLVLPDGRVIDESIDIMLWALAQNDPNGWLNDDEDDRKVMIAQNDGAFKHHLDRYKYPEKFGCDAREHRDAGEAMLRRYETLLTQSPFLSGPKAGFTDYALLPFIRQFAHVDRDYFYALPFPYLHNWLRGHLESGLFLETMAHFPVWSPGDEMRFLIG